MSEDRPRARPTRFIHVVAGVIRDGRGRILLARRTEGRDLAGLWEFPGGKREQGETPQQALQRELREELGIECRVGAPLISVPQQYPDKRLVLDVWHVESWQGPARGREGQALVWLPPEKLPLYEMPPADRPVVAALLHPSAYLVTPRPDVPDAWLTGISGALEAGIRRIQLRAPGLAPERWEPLVAHAAELCRSAGAEVLVNHDVGLATRHGIGVHLKAAQLHELAARPLPADLLVAASCHNAADLGAAQAKGCDFAVLGHVAPTPSHPGMQPLGWPGFAALREQVALPLYAIGGLDRDDITAARGHGAQGIAAIRGLWPGVDLGS